MGHRPEERKFEIAGTLVSAAQVPRLLRAARDLYARNAAIEPTYLSSIIAKLEEAQRQMSAPNAS